MRIFYFFFVKPWSCTEQTAEVTQRQLCGRNRSDGERNEAVVSLDVPLEDFGAGPEHALEAGPVQLHALQGSTRHHRGGSGPVEQQRDLTCKQGRRRCHTPSASFAEGAYSTHHPVVWLWNISLHMSPDRHFT